MKKNNGFTLVELIAVIVIMGIIFIITIPQIQKTSINSKIKLCQNKLNLIEDSLNLFLSTNQECYDDSKNNCYICTETKNGKCITNVERLAELGIVERDNKNDDVINPINKTIINGYRIMVQHDSDSGNFISNFLAIGNQEDEIVDSNYSSICKSNSNNGIKEGEGNPSFGLHKEYNVYLIKEGDCNDPKNPIKADIYTAKLASFCEQANDNEQYAFTKYEVIDENDIDNDNNNNLCHTNDNNNNILYCYFEPKPNPTLKINISDEDSVKISNIIKEKNCDQNNNSYEYSCEPNQKIEIAYELKTGDVSIENISCSPNVCEKDLSNNKITINMKYDSVLVRIDTNSKYRLDYYIDEANGSDNSYQKYDISSTYVNTKAEAEKICHEKQTQNQNIISTYTVDKSYNERVYRCKFNRKKFKINLKTDDYVLNSNVATESVYKYGQTVNLNFTFSEGYYFGNIDYKNTTLTKENIKIPDDILSVERGNNTNIITFTMPSNDVDLSIISGKKYNMTVYDHYQNADNGGNYSTNIGNSNVFTVVPLDEKIDINQFCKYNEDGNIYTLNSNYNYYVKDKNEINCYYDRKLVTVNFDKSNVHINSITISPDSHSLYTSNKISEGQVAHQYRYGQNIIMRIDSYERDYEYNGVDCLASDNCIIGLDGTTKIKANNDMTVTPKTNDIVETFKVYNHYQNTDNKDGYSTEYIGLEEVVLSKGDIGNAKAICENSKYLNTKNSTFNYNDNISYLVRDIHEINCYYDRATVKLKYNIDSNISSFGYAPTNNNETNNNEVEYRYGQNIILKINKYNTGYSFENFDVKCTENYATCICANDVIKININDKQNIHNNLEVTITKKESE